jgi:hypothetical protein
VTNFSWCVDAVETFGAVEKKKIHLVLDVRIHWRKILESESSIF